MDIFCPNPINLCTDPAVPTANFSSETPDQQAFFGRGYATGVPPLGSEWEATGCLGTCTSTISQADADNCAANQNIICRSFDEPDLEPNPNPDQPDFPYIPVQRQTFGNDLQECEIACPDGSTFGFQVSADTILAFTQAEADASALSLACNQATQKRICLGELSPSGACVGTLYDGEVEISGLNPPYTITVTSGALPPGLVMVQDPNTAFISGTPTVAGTHIFTLRAQDADGNFNEKTYTVLIVEIANDTLAEGIEGNVYSETLTTIGPVTGAVTWAITSGSLPTGLSLNAASGAITGTPTADGDYTFTVSMTDEALLTCSKEFTVTINPGVDFSELVWTTVTNTEDGTGVNNWISPGEGGTGSTWEVDTSASISGAFDRAHLIIRGDMVYAGPNRNCQAVMTVTNNEIVAEPGSNNLQVQFLLGGVVQNTANMPAGLNGQFTLLFTAQAGLLTILANQDTINPDGAQSNPMTLHCSGVVENL